MCVCVFVCSAGRGVWHGEERHGYRCHVRDASGADHEVHHSCGHGGNHRYIRAGGGRPHRQQHLGQDHSVQVRLNRSSLLGDQGYYRSHTKNNNENKTIGN